MRHIRLSQLCQLWLMLSATSWAQAPFDAEMMALKFNHPVKCEQEAARIFKDNPDNGWAMLKACSAAGYWPELSRIVEPPWRAEFKKRPDAAALFARICASRGGDIEADYAKLADDQFPFFTLPAAMQRPKLAKRQLVVFRGALQFESNLEEVKMTQFSETSLHSKDPAKIKKQKGKYYSNGEEHDYRGYYDRNANGSNYSWDSRTRTYQASQFTGSARRNAVTETGRHVLLKMPKRGDPIPPERDHICVMRFDGTAMVATDEQGLGEEEKVGFGALVECHTVSSKVWD